MKKIAITIQNFVQFYSVKPFIDSFKDAQIDLFVPEAINDMGFKEMFDDIYDYLVEHKYNVYRKVDMSVKYKILLEPYPMDIYMVFNYEYRIKYQYALNTSKPKLIYKCESNIFYDAILCHSIYEEEMLKNFSKTYLVGKLNFIDYEKEKHNDKKKTLLYLPTYGNLNYIDVVVEQLKKISSKYNIIVKQHHGTNYLNYEGNKKEKIYEYFDKVYDSTVSLNDLLKEADGVLSDSSGAIFDSLYANVPVCIFSENIEDCSLGDLDSLQYKLVKQKVIPFTSNINKLSSIVDDVFKEGYAKKQMEVSNKLFPIEKEKILSSFVDVINIYLNDELSDLDKDYMKLHRSVINEYNEYSKLKTDFYELNQDKFELIDKNNILTYEKNNLQNELNGYQNGKLYRIATKIYSLKSKLRRKPKQK